MSTKSSQGNLIPVWDPSVRLFHWGLVVLIGFAYISGESEGDLIELHAYAGYGVLGLVLYRLIWGFIGSHYARFAEFVKPPKTALDYLQAAKAGEHPTIPGHNPLGGYMVIALLGLCALQAFSGLFATDDIFFEGPLNSLVSSSAADLITGFHHLNFNLIMLAVIAHVAAVVFHTRFRGEKLVPGMVHGKKEAPAGTEVRSYAPVWKMAISAVIPVGLVCYLITLS